MRKILSLLLALLALVGGGCVHDVTYGGPVVTRTYDITDFTAVKVISSHMGTQVYHTFTVKVVPADTYSVLVTANKNLFPLIHVTRSGSILQIVLGDMQVSFTLVTLEARITMPRLWQISASGAAEVTVIGFKSGHDFSLELSDGARADLDIETGDFTAIVSASMAKGRLKSADANIKVNGSSGIYGNYLLYGGIGGVDFEGIGRNLTLHGVAGGEAVLDGFPVNNADVTLMGMLTRAYLTLNGRLDVTLTDSALLMYSGNVTLGRTSIDEGSVLRQRP